MENAAISFEESPLLLRRVIMLTHFVKNCKDVPVSGFPQGWLQGERELCSTRLLRFYQSTSTLSNPGFEEFVQGVFVTSFRHMCQSRTKSISCSGAEDLREDMALRT